MKSLLTYLAVVIAVSALVYIAVAPVKTGEPASLVNVAIAFASVIAILGLARVTSKG